MQQFTHENNQHDWPLPLSLERGSLLPWPKEVFPCEVGNFVEDLSRSTETPVELASMIVLATVATAAQKKYSVQIKPDYSEPVNIWTLVILPPASRKSRVFSEITQGLKKWEKEQKELTEPLIKSATSQFKTMEARLKELRIKAARTKNDEDYLTSQNEIEKLEREVLEIPNCPQIWTSDITPEHLGTIMALNDCAMAVISPEGGIFDILGGLYSDGRSNIDLFLQAHACDSVRVERGSRPPVFMDSPILTMGLTAQPEVIHSICKNRKFRGRGLLGRFLYVMPPSNIGQRTLDQPPIKEHLSPQFQKILHEILNHEPADNQNLHSKHFLSLTPEAYQKWGDYAKAVEVMMSEEMGHLSHITDWAGKLPGAIARIAGLLHIVRYSKEKPWKVLISLVDMSAAIKIGHALTSHALQVFDHFNESTIMQISKSIYRWLKHEKILSFSQRECLRKFRRHRKEELRPALEFLIENEIIRENESNSPGRPSIVFNVNPHIFP